MECLVRQHRSRRVTPDIKNDQPLALLGRFHFVLQQSRRYDAHAYIKITIPSTSSEEIPLSIVPKKTGQSRVRGILLERDNLIGVPWWGEANFAHEGCIKANSSADLNKWGAGATVARYVHTQQLNQRVQSTNSQAVRFQTWNFLKVIRSNRVLLRFFFCFCT